MMERSFAALTNVTDVGIGDSQSQPSGPSDVAAAVVFTVVRRPELYAVCTLLALFSVLGSAGNSLVLYVFARRRDRLVSTLYIEVLAVVDLCASFVLMPFTAYMEYFDFHIEYDVACKAYMFLITSNIPFSALIMVAIAIDRYLCICHPFAGLMTIRRAKILIAAMTAFVTAIGICVSLQYGTYGYQEPTEAPTAATSSDSTDWSSISHVDVPAASTPIASVTGQSGVINAGSQPEAVVSSADNVATTQRLIVRPVENTSAVMSGTNSSRAPASYDEHLTAGGSGQILEHTGHCAPSDLLIGQEFQYYYQVIQV